MDRMETIALRLDAQSSEPLYRQIFDQVVTAIRGGRLAPGAKLPPSRKLAAALGTHRNTVVHAYEELEAAGFVRSGVGSGTYVRDLGRTAAHAAAAPWPEMPWARLLAGAARITSYETPAVPAGRDLVDLSRMQPPPELLPAELFQRCIDHVLRRLGPRALGYGPREGVASLRRLLAEGLRTRGIRIGEDDLLITTGSQQGLDLLARALVQPGDVVLVESSTYTGALRVLTAAGARLVPVPCDEQGPEMRALEQLGRAGAKALYVMPDCRNPTGEAIAAERREQLVHWSHEHGVPLLEDDYGADLELEARPPAPPLRALSREVVYLGTFSKKLIPALRVGFLVCPPALRALLVPLKQTMDLGTSALLQHALAEFLERGYLEAHLGRVRAEYRVRRDALEAALAEHLPPPLRWRHPERGVMLWLPLPETLEPRQAFDAALQHGVVVSPGPLFTVEGRREHGLRLIYSYEPPERLQDGARRLGAALRQVLAAHLAGAEPQRLLGMV